MAKDQFIFTGDGTENADKGADADPRTDSADDERRRAEENLARFLSDPENALRRPGIPPVTPKAFPDRVASRQRAAASVAASDPVDSPTPESEPAASPQVPAVWQEPPAQPPEEPPSGAQEEAAPERPPSRRRRWLATFLRLIFFAVLCAMVWLPTLYYLQNAQEVFQTSWRIILPGDGIKSSIDIDEVGEAKTSEKSIFASRNFDPRSTYREIAGSGIVKGLAARSAEVESGTFVSPKVKVIPQTAILEFSLRRNDPQTALEHARIFMSSFDERVQELRSTDLRSRKDVALDNVRALRTQLMEKQRAKLALQREAGLLGEEDYKGIVESAGKRRNELIDAEVDLRNIVERFRALASTLQVAPQIASRALTLKSDQLFQSLARAYVEATTELARLDGNFGPSHPERIMTAARRDEYLTEIRFRIWELTGEFDGDIDLLLDLTQSTERSALFSSLVSMKADLAGQLAKVQELQAVVSNTDAMAVDLADDADRVAAADQEAQIANAVFASSLANADLSQTNPYASYPLYQVLDEPWLPRTPVAPKKVEAIVGAVGATLLIITGFMALWYRRRILERRRKKA